MTLNRCECGMPIAMHWRSLCRTSHFLLNAGLRKTYLYHHTKINTIAEVRRIFSSMLFWVSRGDFFFLIGDTSTHVFSCSSPPPSAGNGPCVFFSKTSTGLICADRAHAYAQRLDAARTWPMRWDIWAIGVQGLENVLFQEPGLKSFWPYCLIWKPSLGWLVRSNLVLSPMINENCHD